MASDAVVVAKFVELLAPAGEVRSRAMFGEYAIYLDEKLVASVCDNHLFVKPSEVGAGYLSETDMAPPYPGSKPHFLIPESLLGDQERLVRFVKESAAALPAPKPKKGKKG